MFYLSQPMAMPYSAASDSEIFDESGHSKLNPRTSMSGGEDDCLSTPKRKFSRFQIGVHNTDFKHRTNILKLNFNANQIDAWFLFNFLIWTIYLILNLH